MFEELRRWLDDPANAKEYFRCVACGRLRSEPDIGQRVKAKLPACPCGRNPKREFTDAASVTWFERKRILIRSIIEFWRQRHAGVQAHHQALGRPPGT